MALLVSPSCGSVVLVYPPTAIPLSGGPPGRRHHATPLLSPSAQLPVVAHVSGCLLDRHLLIFFFCGQ